MADDLEQGAFFRMLWAVGGITDPGQAFVHTFKPTLNPDKPPPEWKAVVQSTRTEFWADGTMRCFDGGQLTFVVFPDDVEDYIG